MFKKILFSLAFAAMWGCSSGNNPTSSTTETPSDAPAIEDSKTPATDDTKSDASDSTASSNASQTADTAKSVSGPTPEESEPTPEEMFEQCMKQRVLEHQSDNNREPNGSEMDMISAECGEVLQEE